MITTIPGTNTPARACRLVMMALAPLLVWGAHPAAAQDCGATIGPEEPGVEVFLDGDIGPCATDPALTIEGPVAVNLSGFTISCVVPDEGEGTVGIEVVGVNALVLNGVVEDCEDGVVLADDDPEWGQHILTKLTVRSTQDKPASRGFRVRSDNNQLIDNQANRFNGEGFRVEGSDNILVNNLAFKNFDEGFRLRDGAHNTLIGNRAKKNGATDGEAGIRIQNGSNTLLDNSFIRNFGWGIRVTDGAVDNTIIHNVAVGNRDTDLVDENENLDCDGNLWSNNRFRTRSPGCIE